jgi:hypothetical protein
LRYSPKRIEMASTFLGNTSAFCELFTHVDNQFSKIYARCVFIHWHVNEGLEIVECDEARSKMTDLIQEDEMHRVSPTKCSISLAARAGCSRSRLLQDKATRCILTEIKTLKFIPIRSEAGSFCQNDVCRGRSDSFFQWINRRSSSISA